MTSLEAFEDALHGVLSEIDGALEGRWGARWPLHPARPPRGAAANPQYDGLFRVTAAFSAGFGSRLGPGYLFRVEMSTLAEVPAVEREAIEAEAARLLREGLARAFPGRDLRVDRDGAVLKIHGDLSLAD
jgi:hypothetical protein